MRQIGFALSQSFIEATLANHPRIARLLVQLFKLRFDPQTADAAAATSQVNAIEQALEKVSSLSEDRVLRQYLALILATSRTNYWRTGVGASGDAGPRRPFLSFKFDPSKVPGLPEPRPMFEIFVYSTALRGRSPARRQGRARRPALVRPAGGLPHRGAGPREGADGEEHRHRAGRQQGRVRAEEGAAGHRPRRAAEGRHRLLPELPARPARPDRQPGGRQGRAAAAGRAARRRRSVSRRRGGQGNGHVLRLRQRDQPRVRPLARRRVRVRRQRGLRPQEDGHHRARRLGKRQAALPRTRHRHAVDRLHGGRHRRHVRRRVRQRHAAVAAHPARRGVRPPARVPRPESRSRGELRRARTDLRAAAFVVGRLQPVADLGGRRHLGAVGEVDSRLAAGAGGARHRGGAPDARRADLGDPEGAGRPALQRRHRHLREVVARDARRRRRPRERRGADRRRGTALQGRRRGRQPRLHAARSRRGGARRCAAVHGRDRQLGGRGHVGPRGQHQDPAGPADRRRRADREAAQRPARRDDRRGRAAGAARQLLPDAVAVGGRPHRRTPA